MSWTKVKNVNGSGRYTVVSSNFASADFRKIKTYNFQKS